MSVSGWVKESDNIDHINVRHTEQYALNSLTTHLSLAKLFDIIYGEVPLLAFVNVKWSLNHFSSRFAFTIISIDLIC